jgi:hypothetical protein
MDDTHRLMSSWTEINDEWNDPSTYDREQSYDEDGKYPPDWGRRRRAVWQRQSDRCGRCGRARDDVASSDVHHLRALSSGGSNALENLVGLCGDCHSLAHPLNDSIDGSYPNAPAFPARDAVDKVATVRGPTTDDEFSDAFRTDLERIETVSSPTHNGVGSNTHTYDIEADYARRLPDQTTELLQSHGIIAESSDYYTLDITVTLAGFRGVLTTYTPEFTVDSDGALVESTKLQGRWRTLTAQAVISEDATMATVGLTDGRGTTERDVTLNAETVEVTFTARPIQLFGSS